MSDADSPDRPDRRLGPEDTQPLRVVRPQAQQRWEPLPQGNEYESEATAFVQLPEGFTSGPYPGGYGYQGYPDAYGTGAPDSHGAGPGADHGGYAADPLAAPGHGYTPPSSFAPPTPSATTDPSATGQWTMPFADGPAADLAAHGMPDAGPHAGAPGGHYAEGPDNASQALWPAAGTDGSSGTTGQWAIPTAPDEVLEESGEYLLGDDRTHPASGYGNAYGHFDHGHGHGHAPADPAATGQWNFTTDQHTGTGHLPYDQQPHRPADQVTPGYDPGHGVPPAGETQGGTLGGGAGNWSLPADALAQWPPRAEPYDEPRTEPQDEARAHGEAQALGEAPVQDEVPVRDEAPVHGDASPLQDAEPAAEPVADAPVADVPVSGEPVADAPAATGPADADAAGPAVDVPDPAEAATGPTVDEAGPHAVGAGTDEAVTAEPDAAPEADVHDAHDVTAATPPADAQPTASEASEEPGTGTPPAPAEEGEQAPADAVTDAPAPPAEPTAPVMLAEPVPAPEPAAADPAAAEEPPAAPESEAAPAAAPAPVEEPTPEPSPESTPEPTPPATPSPAPDTAEAPAPDAALTPDPHDEHPHTSYVLTVNGTDRPVTEAWIGESLLYVLRERLGLAGAKDGCSQGECGACSVQVDGRLVASCLVPAATTAGSEIRTVEGLAQNGAPSDVQCALAESGAVQCGFCIPGMAMTVHDLLEGNHAPTELEARQALCGNLCRCSGYRGVLDAVNEVVRGRADAAAAAEEAAASAPAESGTPRIPHQAGPADPQGPAPHGHHPHGPHPHGPGADPQSGGSA
ncbi:hypothetical protein A6A06_06400 [Streptomyces sp. CB02923]|uniref:2Fe-2S iron-sulfur cluster-binding protein n=1 Tax=Streptomyces sp. CB02923 TaxID=1718985 RepID=UPI0009659DBD|nr:2Fe-2S iron-sulfur cluster-binding protein [Streptomyces sp. CB02923]OKI04434.1 hypothetical protein A6A06_06400 [Streptomyces sp. CB02923]